MIITFGFMRSFYSTLVRLKEGGVLLAVIGNRFLFHIGAIKSPNPELDIVDVWWFLFHIGAIKSMFYTHMRHVGRRFLFHIGAIKRIRLGLEQ